MQLIYGVCVGIIVVLTLQGCGDGGDTPSTPTPRPTPSPTPSPTPVPYTSVKMRNETMLLGFGAPLLPNSSTEVHIEVSKSLVVLATLQEVYTKYKNAFSSEAASLIDATISNSSANVAGPALTMMLSNLPWPLNDQSHAFLKALHGMDEKTVKLGPVDVTLQNHGKFTTTAYACVKIFKIMYYTGPVQKPSVAKTLTSLNSGAWYTCKKSGSDRIQLDSIHMDQHPLISSLVIV